MEDRGTADDDARLAGGVLGAAALGGFVWSRIRGFLLAELVVVVVAAGAFLLTQPGRAGRGGRPVRLRASGRTAPAGSRL